MGEGEEGREEFALRIGELMTKVETKQASARYIFKVKEGISGPFLVAEPNRDEIPLFKFALLIFNLPQGTSLHKAEKIAEFMNDNLGDMSLALFDAHPVFHRVDNQLRFTE